MQHVHILGSGAMGCLWGSYYPTSTRLTFISRNRQSNTFSYVVSPTGKSVNSELELANSSSIIDFLIVATKSFDALNAVRSVAHRLASQAQILVLQNGMGSQQDIANEFNGHAVYACSSTEGAYKKNVSEVVHAGQGVNTVGPLTTLANQNKLSKYLPKDKFQWSEQIETILWKKLLVNCAINPLTAIYHCQNGKLLEIADAQKEMTLLCAEMDAVTEKLGLGLTNSLDLAISVCKQTAKNYSSMYQDVKHQRQTEIEFITGYLIQKCEQHEVLCPTHRDVYQRIKALNLGGPSDLG